MFFLMTSSRWSVPNFFVVRSKKKKKQIMENETEKIQLEFFSFSSHSLVSMVFFYWKDFHVDHVEKLLNSDEKKRSEIEQASIFEIFIITVHILCEHYLTFVLKLWLWPTASVRMHIVLATHKKCYLLILCCCDPMNL